MSCAMLTSVPVYEPTVCCVDNGCHVVASKQHVRLMHSDAWLLKAEAVAIGVRVWGSESSRRVGTAASWSRIPERTFAGVRCSSKPPCVHL